MALFGKKSKAAASELVLVCDIGSARVAAALVLLRDGAVPQMLYRTEHPIVFQKELDFSRFTLSMLDSLSKVLATVETEGLRHIHFGGKKRKRVVIQRAVCIYASPWHLSHTKVLQHNPEDPFTVTQELIDAAIEQEGKTFTENELIEYEESVGAGMELIEQQVTGIRLDGYTVSNPIGREAHELSFVVTVTMMASALREAVEERLQKTIHTTDIRHHSFGYVGFVALRDLFQDANDFLLIDVTGEISDISVIQNDVLLSSASFPYGSRNLIREISKTHNTQPETARSMVKNFVTGDGNQEIQESLENAQHKWTMHLVDALNTAGESTPLPQKVFCVIDENLSALFQRAAVEAFTQIQSVRSAEDFTLISSGLLQGHIDFRAGITEDPFLALETLYVNRT